MRCLNVKLTYECSNNCSFCFSSYLKNEKIDLEYVFSMMKKGFEDGCRHIVLSGGEPTLYPDKLIATINEAIRLGYIECTIQSNGFGFADENSNLLMEIKKISKKIALKISISVHGHKKEIQESMNNTANSFKDLKKALKNISELDCELYTNTVISTININHLKEIYEFILIFNPVIAQFAVMHVTDGNELSPGLINSVVAIKNQLSLVDKNILRTEGIPFCLLKSFERCVGESYWPSILDLCNKNNDYMEDFNQLDCDMRFKSGKCVTCIFDEICHGVWYEHKDEFNELDIQAIRLEE